MLIAIDDDGIQTRVQQASEPCDPLLHRLTAPTVFNFVTRHTKYQRMLPKFGPRVTGAYQSIFTGSKAFQHVLAQDCTEEFNESIT